MYKELSWQEKELIQLFPKEQRGLVYDWVYTLPKDLRWLNWSSHVTRLFMTVRLIEVNTPSGIVEFNIGGERFTYDVNGFCKVKGKRSKTGNKTSIEKLLEALCEVLKTKDVKDYPDNLVMSKTFLQVLPELTDEHCQVIDNVNKYHLIPEAQLLGNYELLSSRMVEMKIISERFDKPIHRKCLLLYTSNILTTAIGTELTLTLDKGKFSADINTEYTKQSLSVVHKCVLDDYTKMVNIVVSKTSDKLFGSSESGLVKGSVIDYPACAGKGIKSK